MDARPCEHDVRIVIVAGIEHAFCSKCGSFLSLRAVASAFASSEKARTLVERRLSAATATLASIAPHNTWDGESARKCLEAIGREDLVPRSPRKAG